MAICWRSLKAIINISKSFAIAYITSRARSRGSLIKCIRLLLDKDYLHDNSTYQIQDRHLQEHGAVYFRERDDGSSYSKEARRKI